MPQTNRVRPVSKGGLPSEDDAITLVPPHSSVTPPKDEIIRRGRKPVRENACSEMCEILRRCVLAQGKYGNPMMGTQRSCGVQTKVLPRLPCHCASFVDQPRSAEVSSVIPDDQMGGNDGRRGDGRGSINSRRPAQTWIGDDWLQAE